MQIAQDALLVTVLVLCALYPVAQKRLPTKVQSVMVGLAGAVLLALGLTNLFWLAVAIGAGGAVLGTFLFWRERQGGRL